MNNSGAIAGLIIGIFLIVVVDKGNGPKLIELATRDKDFLKWMIAIFILVAVRDDVPTGGAKGVVDLIILAAFAALGINSISSIKSNASAFWKTL